MLQQSRSRDSPKYLQGVLAGWPGDNCPYRSPADRDEGVSAMRTQTLNEVEDPEEAAFDARYRDAARLIAEGREVQATLLQRETSDRRYRGVQIVIGVFEIEDPMADEPRTIEYEHIFGPAL